MLSDLVGIPNTLLVVMGIILLFLDEKVIQGFIPSARADHYRPSLVDGSIIKLDRKFDHLQALANTNLELSDVVVQIRYVQGSDLNNAAATTRLVVRLLIEPNVSRSPNTGDKTVCNGGYNCESKDIRRYSLLLRIIKHFHYGSFHTCMISLLFYLIL
ncbi:unnamed protein product [Brassica oleracea var. botrytis]